MCYSGYAEVVMTRNVNLSMNDFETSAARLAESNNLRCCQVYHISVQVDGVDVQRRRTLCI